MTLRPDKIGDIPVGLPPYHQEFLRKVRDAIQILIGARRAQADTAATPGSQAVTFDDLTELGLIGGAASTAGEHSITFMHMGAL